MADGPAISGLCRVRLRCRTGQVRTALGARGGAVGVPRCRLCSAELDQTFVDLGMSPPCESYLRPEAARPGRDLLPAARADLRDVPAGPAAGLHRRGGHLQRLRLLLVVLRLVGRATPRTFVEDGGRPARAGRRLLHGRGGQQRRLPAAAQRRPRDPVAGHRARRQRRRGGAWRGECRPRWCSSARRPAGRSPDVTGPADLVVANNVFAHVPDIVDFSRGLRALVADDGNVSIEIPHLLRLIEGDEYDTIYHEHYSYLSAADGPAGAGRGRADGRRRRGAADPRRFDAAWSVPNDQCRSGRAPPSAEVLADEAGRGSAHPRGPRRLRRRRSAGSATTSWSS